MNPWVLGILIWVVCALCFGLGWILGVRHVMRKYGIDDLLSEQLTDDEKRDPQ